MIKNKDVGSDSERKKEIAFMQKFKQWWKSNNFAVVSLSFFLGTIIGVATLEKSDFQEKLRMENAKQKLELFCNENGYSLTEGIEILKNSNTREDSIVVEGIGGQGEIRQGTVHYHSIGSQRLDKFKKDFTKNDTELGKE